MLVANASVKEAGRVISIRRVSLGGGYRYLIDSVAAGDGNPEPSKGLAHYYASTGTPPGVFLGAGLADLDGGKGVEKGSQVSEEHLFNMLVELCDPVSGEPLGGRLTVPGNSCAGRRLRPHFQSEQDQYRRHGRSPMRTRKPSSRSVTARRSTTS